MEGQESYEKILAILPEEPEFAEQRILLQALAGNDVSKVVPLPGRVISTFCEIATEWGVEVELPANLDLKERAVAESATNLSIYFGVKLQQELTGMYPGSQMLLDMYQPDYLREDAPRHPDRSSFLDELRLLLCHYNSDDFCKFAKTRYSKDEGWGLEALSLGGGYGIS